MADHAAGHTWVMDPLLLLLLVGALVSFGAATLLVSARVNLVALGLFFATLYALFVSPVVDRLTA